MALPCPWLLERAIPAPGSALGCWIWLCSITDFQPCLQGFLPSVAFGPFPSISPGVLSQGAGGSWRIPVVLPPWVQGWQETSGSPLCRAWLLGGGRCLKAECPGSFPPPSLGRRGSTRTRGPGGSNARGSPGSQSLQGRFSCLCSPKFWVPTLILVLWAGSLLHSQLEQGPLPVPPVADGGEGACAGIWGSSVIQPVAQPRVCSVAPRWHFVTAHSPRHSSLGFPWHQSLSHPRLYRRRAQAVPIPCLSAPPGMLRLQQRAKTIWGGGTPSLARSGTAVDVGDAFIMQNYPVLLCKITVCGVSEQGTEGSAGSSITWGSIALITLIRCLHSPRRCGAPVGCPEQGWVIPAPSPGAGGASHPPHAKGALLSPLWIQKGPGRS